MVSEGWLLLLPISAASGWWIAVRKMPEDKHSKKRHLLSSNYLQGLNFLLNEEPDKALDVFIKLLEIDSDTVETHLALGNLFRRRGEVNRAIRIHQNLIARPNLEKKYRTEALAALAKDYLSAGVFDRAERLFLELVDLGEKIDTSLQNLLDIYQQEKEWQKAIDIAQKLFLHTNRNMRVGLAHYYCELAELALREQNLDQARKTVKRAFRVDKRCARASLLLAEVEMQLGRYRRAMRYLKYIKKQDPDYLSEAVRPLMKCYQALEKETELVYYFKDLLKEFPKIPIVVILSEQIRQWRGDKVAANFVANYVRRHPSVEGLHRLVELHLSLVEGQAKSDLQILHHLTEKLLADQPTYQCLQCGFSSQHLHWQCPGCRQWATIKPTHTVEV